jgi:hypothetical protein
MNIFNFVGVERGTCSRKRAQNEVLGRISAEWEPWIGYNETTGG